MEPRLEVLRPPIDIGDTLDRYSQEALSGWPAAAATGNPFTSLLQGLRAVLAEGRIGSDILATFGAVAAGGSRLAHVGVPGAAHPDQTGADRVGIPPGSGSARTTSPVSSRDIVEEALRRFGRSTSARAKPMVVSDHC